MKARRATVSIWKRVNPEQAVVRANRAYNRLVVDQASFMRAQLSLAAFKGRLQELLLSLAARPWSIGSETSVVKVEALEALHYTAISGPVERARFMAMTGLAPRVARRVLSGLLHFGVLKAATSRAPVAFAVPLKSLRFLFPRLWPEAEADGAD